MRVKHKKTGLFIREDSELGVLVYSPYTGLFFSCLEEGKAHRDLMRWLVGDLAEYSLENYTKSIGAGWFVPKNKAQYPREHVLSSSEIKLTAQKPDYPILINWLITNQCSCNCLYC